MTFVNKGLYLPSWSISIIISLLIVVGGYLLANGATTEKIKHNEEDIVNLQTGKASDDKVDGMQQQLNTMQGSIDRIEDYIMNQ